MLRPRLAVLRQGRSALPINPIASSQTRRAVCTRPLTTQSQLFAATPRPSLPFLTPPSSNTTSVRYFTSTRSGWIRHEVKLAARYTLTLWGMLAAGLVILFFVQEELVEREHPTPHEWTYMTRKFLRDAKKLEDPKDGNIQWANALGRARSALMRLSDPRKDGAGLVALSDEATDPTLQDPVEFVPYDITAKSEEWRRGYFEALMMAAKTAEHVDGWVLDVTRNMVSPAKFVIGPSNPHPTPIPPGAAHAPLEENCVDAFPPADRWYMKILATKGLTERQRLEAALEYASFMEYKSQAEAARSLQELALAEATRGIDAADLPYDGKTLALKERAGSPSLNLLDVLGAMANSKARGGDLSGALPMYVSLLKARRGLSDERPPAPPRTQPRHNIPVHQRLLNLLSPPAYPPPPPDGTRPPWRSPEERCQEAALQVYIGEILYATSSRDDGLSWTRDGVDLAEEQLRALGPGAAAKDPAKKACRECLGAGLDNWHNMVARLARAERAMEADKPSMFSFWGGGSAPEGRWAAEEAVVQERVRRTKELMEDVAPPRDFITNWFKA
ncbi:hypothetical protein ISF_08170 [Cordyceps fumosorosea ARSEF 2679]|uniref:MFS maltose permease n=1 Tax=Cordyceps fumosorosea (strain ARSEF 2679) TaxID=1081104 RepID=A0A167MYB7_CORFA|nr:hypothetical protein ISF_08170 [Cordyceps fumosorosea ARSEF 2679]OAA54899.1 hypothetical protein ISF_08170 [Cordyceps fumosorosea ARSEF 2679]